MHVAVSPVEFGPGVRLWTSPDELLDRFHLDVVPGPRGVTHHLFWRKRHTEQLVGRGVLGDLEVRRWRASSGGGSRRSATPRADCAAAAPAPAATPPAPAGHSTLGGDREHPDRRPGCRRPGGERAVRGVGGADGTRPWSAGTMCAEWELRRLELPLSAHPRPDLRDVGLQVIRPSGDPARSMAAGRGPGRVRTGSDRCLKAG
ncbi:protein of unknown function [Blastococcus saxobsidens DD2]|uniref:Uncharacterized protein n=1 Tax=Blastococcus saxobsidens (strain DD2) TaxID=1146883 RepID=H6RRA8_BLASD|nr:protein of unknown function [Blastococcus saxobsidens DD2]